MAIRIEKVQSSRCSLSRFNPNKVYTANLWFKGSQFLLNGFEHWPEELEFNEIHSLDDEKVKKESVCNVLQDLTIIYKLLQRFSNYQKIINFVRWFFRFKTFVCWKYGGSDFTPTGSLSVKDIKEATKQIVKFVQ